MNFEVEVRCVCATGLAVVTNYLTSFYFCSYGDSCGDGLEMSVEEVRAIRCGQTDAIACKAISCSAVRLCDCSIGHCVDEVPFLGNDVDSNVKTTAATWGMPSVFERTRSLYWEHRDLNCWGSNYAKRNSGTGVEFSSCDDSLCGLKCLNGNSGSTTEDSINSTLNGDSCCNQCSLNNYYGVSAITADGKCGEEV